MLLLGVSLAVAAVPEGLPAILSLVLALGVQRMARRNAVVKTPLVRRDARLGIRHLHGQDRHADDQRDDDPANRRRRPERSSVSGAGYAPKGAVTSHGRDLEDGPLRDEAVVGPDRRHSPATPSSPSAAAAGRSREIRRRPHSSSRRASSRVRPSGGGALRAGRGGAVQLGTQDDVDRRSRARER